MIDLRYVKKLIEMIDESTVDSIEISSDKGMKIRISKSPQQRGTVQVAAPLPVSAMLPPAVPGRVTPGEGLPALNEPATPSRAEASKTQLLEVHSAKVATLDQSPQPGAKHYVDLGHLAGNGDAS